MYKKQIYITNEAHNHYSTIQLNLSLTNNKKHLIMNEILFSIEVEDAP